ncbi:MAG: hypothetical protein ACLFWM_08495 [Actinomycetota bacterium]
MSPLNTQMIPARRFPLLLAAVGVTVILGTVLGAGVRATYGAATTADEPQYLLSAISIWEDGDLDISDELASRRYLEFHEVALPTQTRPLADGRRVSPHDPLLPLLLALPVGLGGWMGAKAAMAVMAGGLAALVVWIAHRRLGVRSGVAAAVVLVFALSPPLAVYSTQTYPELPAAAVVALAVALLTGAPRPAAVWAAVGAVVALPWLAVKYVPLAAVLAIGTLLWAPRRARYWIIGSLGLAGLVYAVAHLAIYEGLTPYAAGDHFVGGELTAVGTDPDLWGRASRLVGLVVDRGFGLASWQPAFFLLPVAAGFAWKGRPRYAPLLIALVATGWLVATFLALTMHGWWFPGRQLVVVLPISVLLVARWADTSDLRLGVTALLGALGVVAFGFLLGEGLAGRLTWVVDFGATANPVYGLYAPLLPDYMSPSPATWIRHSLWAVGLAGLVAVGWRAESPDTRERGKVAIERERHPV